MLGMSNAAIFGLSLSAVTATVVTVAGVNGVFDPWINPEKTVSEQQQPAAVAGTPSNDNPATVASTSEPAASAQAPATGTAQTGEGDQVAASPAEEQAEAITPTQKPSVDIVRVEPSGDAVIAGQSDAGALVAVLSNDEVVGKGVANAAGDWAIVLDKPLAPGAHDIAVEARRSDTTEPVRADEAIAVHIPENESEGVLVATNTPGDATEVLQVPDTAKTVVADLVENEDKQKDIAIPVDKPATQTTETPVSENGTAEADPSEIIVAADPNANDPASETQANEAPTPAVPSAEAKEPVVVAAMEPKVAVSEPADEKTRSMTPEPKSEEQNALVSTIEEPKVVASEVAEPAVGEPNIVEPKAEEPAVAAVTADSQPVADPAPTSETIATAPADAAQPVERIEQALEAVEEKAGPKIESTLETAALLPAAEVPEPATVQPKAKPEKEAEPVIVAKAEPKQEPQPEPETKLAKQPEPEQKSKPEPEPSVTVQAVEAEKGQVYVAGESTGEGPVRVYIEEKFVGQAKPNPQGQWILKAPKDIDPGQHSVRADKVQDNKGTVTARAEVVFEREADEVALTPVIAVGSGASAVAAGADVNAGKRRIPAMIIRKGDNLWRISRRHYGQGVRYTTIYQANQGQIRNPNMIFPGQVFLLPQRDLNWASN